MAITHHLCRQLQGLPATEHHEINVFALQQRAQEHPNGHLQSVRTSKNHFMAAARTASDAADVLNDTGCSQYCPCQCHSRRYIRVPRWAAIGLGSGSISYRGSSLLTIQPCDSAGCRKSTARYGFEYAFPTWTTATIRLVVDISDDVSDPGYRWTLRMSQTIPDTHEIWRAVREDNLDYIKSQLSLQTASPNIVDKHGLTMAHVCLYLYTVNPRPTNIFCCSTLSFTNAQGCSAS